MIVAPPPPQQQQSRRRGSGNWLSRYRPGSRDGPILPTPITTVFEPELIPFTRTESLVSTTSSKRSARPSSASARPTTPIFSSKRWSTPSSSVLTTPSTPAFPVTPLTPIQADQVSSPNVTTPSIPPPPPPPPPPSRVSESKGAFTKMVKDGLSALSLTRSSDDTRGRTESKTKSRSNSVASTKDRDASRARSQSPFSLRRFRSREPSPTPMPLEESDTDSVRRTPNVRPKTAFTDDQDSESEFGGDETEDDDDEWSDDAQGFDSVTEWNTEQNALMIPVDDGLAGDMDAEVDPDPLGEGVNVVVPPEPYFPTTLNRTSSGGIARKRGAPKRRKSKTHEELPHSTSRPIFQRDRCTINIIQGDPDAINGRARRFMVGSDLSEESRYAVEWGIGTVLRDGDEMIIVTVVENESKVDPASPAGADRAVKLRSQQERQGLAYILVRQATSLLQRTRLNVIISCQAWHAKNARHMLLDIVDYNEPTMLIVGSRGLSQLKGILLGSTSHYLIEKCPVPVMVARRRLKRPPRRSAHLTKNRVHVSLAEAGIDRVAPKVDQDVAVMRDQIQRDEERRDGGMDDVGIEEEDGEGEGEGEGVDEEDSQGHKVAG